MEFKIKSFLNNSLVQTSFFYTVINFINKAFPFILLPILTRTLSPSDFGEYSLFRALTSILLPLIGFNLSEYIMKNYYSEDHYTFGQKVSISIILNFILFVLFFILTSFLNPNYLINNFDLKKELLLSSFVIALCTSVNNIERNILRCQNNIKLYSILVVGQTFLFFALVISLLFKGEITLKSIVIVEVLTHIFFGLISLLIIKYKFNAKFFINHKLIKIIFIFCLPLVLNSFLAYIFSLSDRFIIARELNTENLGYYSVSFQLVSIIQVLAVAFNTSWTPYLYKKLKEKTSFKYIRNLQSKVLLFFFIILIIYQFVLFFGFEFIVGEQFTKGQYLIKWLLLGTFFQLIYWLNSTVLVFYNKNWFLTMYSLIVTIFSVIANFTFVSLYGIESAAIIYSLSWAILASLTWYKSGELIKSKCL